MAYNFASTNRVEFAITPFTGTTFGAMTMAIYLRRAAVSSLDALINFTTSALGDLTYLTIQSAGNLPSSLRGSTGTATTPSTTVLNSTSTWYLLAVTYAAGAGVTPRFHLHNGTSWAHENAVGTLPDAAALVGSDRLIVGSQFSAASFVGDIVCCGVKKANSTDVTIETLSRTSFQSWRDFGFDWLIGFDSSLEAAGILQDQASPGTGDEIAISGTTPVADPAGWAWTAPATTPVANFTATPLTGTAPLSVAFTDTSTNTPTSWAWDFGDGGTSTAQNPSHSYTTSGTFTVSLTATNSAGSDPEIKTAYITVGETITYIPPYWVAGGQLDIW